MTDRDTITLPREVVKEALAACYFAERADSNAGLAESIAILRTALAAEQPKPEPVATVGTQSAAWKGYDGRWSPPGDPIKVVHLLRDLPVGTLLYTAPPDAEALRRDAERLWQALKRYGKHDDDCGDHDAYNNESMRHCACGLDAVLDETLGDKT